jgi:ribosomal protein S18 acetylase RimI-like enzyme
MAADANVLPAEAEHAGDLARLLHDFNTEFGDFVPEVGLLADRIREQIANGESTFLLVGGGPDGFAQLRFRPSLITGALDAHLEELYVAPAQRGKGRGRALLEAALEEARARGAAHIDLGTSEADVAARALYESAGFTNREGRPDGPVMLYFEREL